MDRCLLLALVVLGMVAISAGAETREKRETEYALNDDDTYYNNYYNRQQQPIRRRQSQSPFGWLSSLMSRSSGYDTGYSGGSSYSSGGGGGGGYQHQPQQQDNSILPYLLLGLGLLAALATGALLAALALQLASSGRGLDNDEWEIDHSVWMDQLQRDFEDSWSEE